MKPVGKPDAGNRPVRFDERGQETECCQMAQATAPVLYSTVQPFVAVQIDNHGEARFGSMLLKKSPQENVES
jgi:hypothetical protein